MLPSLIRFRYLSVKYYIANLTLQRNANDRKATLLGCQALYTSFLRQLDTYGILSSSDAKLFETYLESPTSFSTATSSDPAARRETKISRFKTEKELKRNLEYLERNPGAAENDDELYRRLQLARLAYHTHHSFQALESIAQELHILSLAPSGPELATNGGNEDKRERARGAAGYSERLDGPLSAGLTGPLLSPDGKPMRPFTLLGKRTELRQGVFRPDHNLPTMSIDEYLEEERRRGGIIEGGGPQSGLRPEPNEDDLEKADEETMKARAWDDFVEENPKGAGNTLNRG